MKASQLMHVCRDMALMCLSVGVLGSASAAAPNEARDLSGVWWAASSVQTLRPLDGSAVPLRPEAKKLQEQVAQNIRTVESSTKPPTKEDIFRCAPFGVPRVWLQPFPFQIIEQPNLLSIVYEHNRVFRLVYMDEAVADPKVVDPWYMGHSVGRWDNNTLVIDVVGFNAKTSLDNSGLPHSEQLKIVERLRKIDGGNTLELMLRIEDPQVFTTPWSARLTFKKRRDVQIEDYTCGIGVFDTRSTRAGT